jgi:hypothetical protein
LVVQNTKSNKCLSLSKILLTFISEFGTDIETDHNKFAHFARQGRTWNLLELREWDWG